MGAAPTKAAAQNSFVPSLLVALVGTSTFGLALASGSWGTGAVATGGDIAWRNMSVRNRGAL